MKCLRAKRSEGVNQRQSRFASKEEIEKSFSAQRETLLWLALFVTGDRQSAEKCVVDASELSKQNAGVFSDWLNQWARSITVRLAIAQVRPQVSEGESSEKTDCTHDGHPVLLESEVQALRASDVGSALSDLDLLSRSVLIMRGVQKATVQECALTLGLSRSAIQAGYCRAIRWLDHVQSLQEVGQTG